MDPVASLSRTSAYALVPMEEALRVVMREVQAVRAVRVPVAEGLGRVVAEVVVAGRDVPPFRASCKDGYAVRFEGGRDGDLLKVGGVFVAGGGEERGGERDLGVGECAYVTTGGLVPAGADCVVMVEDTASAGDGIVCVLKWPKGVGVDVRDVGCDVAVGESLLDVGEVIGAAEVGILAGCGVAEVVVYDRVVIGVVSTGDELVDVAEASDALSSGMIVDSNRPMLLAAIREALPFCAPLDLGIVKDEYGAVRDAIADAFTKCHIVLTSGGVSMGNRDLIKPVLEELATVHFGRVIMKPGKPLTFATVPGANRCAIGLPGNPVSAFVCFHLAVAAAARRMAGWTPEAALGSRIDVTLEHDIRLDPQRPEYHRATLQVRPRSPHFVSRAYVSLFRFSCTTPRSGKS